MRRQLRHTGYPCQERALSSCCAAVPVCAHQTCDFPYGDTDNRNTRLYESASCSGFNSTRAVHLRANISITPSQSNRRTPDTLRTTSTTLSAHDAFFYSSPGDCHPCSDSAGRRQIHIACSWRFNTSRDVDGEVGRVWRYAENQ